MDVIYCIDTCSLVRAMNAAYPLEVFPSFWENVGELFISGQLISSEMVYEEISKQDDKLTEWLLSYEDYFQKVDEEVIKVTVAIAQKHPKLINKSEEKDAADPFLIALAKIKDAVLVTEEVFLRNSPHRMKIPDVCEIMEIECINLLAMIKRLGWRFGTATPKKENQFQ